MSLSPKIISHFEVNYRCSLQSPALGGVGDETFPSQLPRMLESWPCACSLTSWSFSSLIFQMWVINSPKLQKVVGNRVLYLAKDLTSSKHFIRICCCYLNPLKCQSQWGWGSRGKLHKGHIFARKEMWVIASRDNSGEARIRCMGKEAVWLGGRSGLRLTGVWKQSNRNLFLENGIMNSGRQSLPLRKESAFIE